MGVDYTLSVTAMESSSGNHLSFGVSLPILSCTMVIGSPLLPCPLLEPGKGIGIFMESATLLVYLSLIYACHETDNCQRRRYMSTKLPIFYTNWQLNLTRR